MLVYFFLCNYYYSRKSGVGSPKLCTITANIYLIVLLFNYYFRFIVQIDVSVIPFFCIPVPDSRSRLPTSDSRLPAP
jgi:hypothetical protein